MKKILGLLLPVIALAGGVAAGENRFGGVVESFLYQGDVTLYNVRADRGHLVEALLANSGAGLAKFFEVGDRVEMTFAANAGHYLEG